MLLLLAGMLRLIRLEDHGLWWDEFLSVNNACGSVIGEPITASGDGFKARDFWDGQNLGNVIRAVSLQDGGNGIVYHVLLYMWTKAFGTHDVIVRLPSAVFSAAVVWLGFSLSGRLFTPAVAWCTAAWLAAHPLLVRYGQEARPYALATFLSLAATRLFVGLLTGTRRSFLWSALYGLVVAAALLTHYLTLSVFVGHALFVLVRREGAFLKSLTTPTLIATVVVLAWLSAGGKEGLVRMKQVSDTYRHRAQSASSDENFALPSTPANLAAGALQVAYQLSGNGLQDVGLRLRTIIPLLLLPVLFLAGCWCARHRIQRVESGLLLTGVIALTGPFASLLLALLSGHIVSFQVHYAIFSVPYFAMLLAAGTSRAFEGRGGASWPIRGAVIAQVFVLMFSLGAVYADAPRRRPPNQFAEIGALLAKGTSLDSVTYPSWTEARLVNLYLPPSAAIRQRVDASVSGEIRLFGADGTSRRIPRPPL